MPGLQKAPSRPEDMRRWFQQFSKGGSLGNGLIMSGNLMTVKGGAGILVDGNGVGVRLASPSGLETTGSPASVRVKVDSSRGMGLDAAGIFTIVDSAGAIVFNATSGGLEINGGDGLVIASNVLKVDPASGSGLVFTTGQLDTSGGTDLSGQLGSANVVGFRGIALKNETPVSAQYWAYNPFNSQYELAAVPTIPADEYDDVLLLSRNADTTAISTAFANLSWDTQLEIATSRFTHSTSTNAEQITLDNKEAIIIDVDVTGEISAGAGTLLADLVIELQRKPSGGSFSTLADATAYCLLLRASGIAFPGTAHLTYSLSDSQVAANDIYRVRVKKIGSATTIIKGGGTRIRFRTVSEGAIE